MRQGATSVVVAALLLVAGCSADSHHQVARSGVGTANMRLWRASESLAKQSGATLVSAQAARTTQRRGTVFMSSADSGDLSAVSTRPVWLVLGRSDRPLDCECVTIAGRDGRVDGRYFAVMFDRTTYELVGGAALLTDKPDLKEVGAPMTLNP